MSLYYLICPICILVTCVPAVDGKRVVSKLDGHDAVASTSNTSRERAQENAKTACEVSLSPSGWLKRCPANSVRSGDKCTCNAGTCAINNGCFAIGELDGAGLLVDPAALGTLQDEQPQEYYEEDEDASDQSDNKDTQAPELPAGWYSAVDPDSGDTYYYDDDGNSQFEFPGKVDTEGEGGFGEEPLSTPDGGPKGRGSRRGT